MKYERPNAQDVPKTNAHRASIALATMRVKREKTGLTDEIIESVRVAIAQKRPNKMIEEDFNLSRDVVSRIKMGRLIKISEMEDAEIAVVHVDAVKQHIPRARRALRANQVLEILNYVKEHPMCPKEVSDRAQELFGVDMTQEQAKNYIKGITLLCAEEFPVDGVSEDDYKALVEEIAKRNYRRLGATYKTMAVAD